MEDIRKTVKEYIVKEFLPGEDPDNLIDSTPLITGGIIDSIGTVKLVAFLEERYGVEFQAHEVAVEHLNTLSDIAGFVQAKL
jgi:acyl carrier protein